MNKQEHCEPPHAHLPGVAVARRLRIDVHDDNVNDNNDNAWQSGLLWPHRMGPITCVGLYNELVYATEIWHVLIRNLPVLPATLKLPRWFVYPKMVTIPVINGLIIE